MNPALARLLKDGAFEFQMGMRCGDDAFFQNRSVSRRLLEERRRWLAEAPGLYAACEPTGEVRSRRRWLLPAR